MLTSAWCLVAGLGLGLGLGLDLVSDWWWLCTPIYTALVLSVVIVILPAAFW